MCCADGVQRLQVFGKAGIYSDRRSFWWWHPKGPHYIAANNLRVLGTHNLLAREIDGLVLLADQNP